MAVSEAPIESNRIESLVMSVQQRRPVICAICKFGFTSVDELRDHELVHSGETVYTCWSCGWYTGQVQELNVHEREAHDVFRCIKCGIVCDCEAEFKFHENRCDAVFHIQQIKYICWFCDFQMTKLTDAYDHAHSCHEERNLPNYNLVAAYLFHVYKPSTLIVHKTIEGTFSRFEPAGLAYIVKKNYIL